MLIILGGLPGTGKTSIARELSRAIGAVHLRIDSIEQSLRDAGKASEPMNDAGYRAAYTQAEEHLRNGGTVIADCVNPLDLTRDAWVRAATKAKAKFVEVEIVRSDVKEHRRRVETRVADIRGLKLPTWEEVVAREYHPWRREHLVVDTSARTVEECVHAIQATIANN